jgi:NADH dehydrogenase
MTTLVVGATGFLGSKICERLRGSGRPVRGLVRETSRADSVAALKKLGVELAAGDLKSPATLAPALAGIKTVVSTASSTVSRVDGDSIESVDLRGQLHLVDAAKRAGVERFVFVSFHRHSLEFPLQTAKRAVESQLISSGLGYTIVQPVDFTEVWLSPAVGFDLAGGSVRILGDGNAKITWVSVDDVADFAAGSVGNLNTRDRIFSLGGPEALSPLEVVERFRAASGKSVTAEHVPESALEAQFASASDPMSRSFAALMLATARGQIASSTAALEAVPFKPRSVQTFIQTLLKSPAH